MTSQRFLAWLLITVQAAALAVQSETVLFPAAMAGLALAGAATRSRLRFTSEQALRAGAVLALIFSAKYLIAPHAIPVERLFIRTQLALAIGQYLLVMQVAQLFLLRNDETKKPVALSGVGAGGAGFQPVREKPDGLKTRPTEAGHGPDGRLTSLLPGLGVIAMICFAAVRVSDHERLIYQVLVVSFVLFSALYFGASRQIAVSSRPARPLGRAAASGAALVAVAAVGWSAAELLFQHERSIEHFISELLSPSHQRTGFTTDGTLGSVTRRRDLDRDELALLVVADQRPGYLRGQTFDTFHRSYWQSTSSRQAVGTALRAPEAIVARAAPLKVFQLRTAAFDAWKIHEVWPADSLDDRLFHPRQTTHIAAAAELLSTDRNGNIQAEGFQPGDPYLVFKTSRSPREELNEAYRQAVQSRRDDWTGDAPQDAGAIARKLAERIFADCRTTRDKIAAVERYFRANYRYSPEVAVPHGQDPLAWFLRDQPAAYCEYFATGAALLLRESGVPTRYVTGFVAAERHRFGDYWVARNKDAHAWVEAWDDERGWVTVEATPAEGVPGPAPPSAAAQLWEYVQNGLRRFRTRLAQGGLAAAVPALVDFLAGVPGIVLLTALVAWVAVQLRRRRRLFARNIVDPRRRTLHRLLSRMDRHLRRRGWERRPGETLHQFAARLLDSSAAEGEIAAVADWYLRYAAIRYDGRCAGDDGVRLSALEVLPRIGRPGGSLRRNPGLPLSAGAG